MPTPPQELLPLFSGSPPESNKSKGGEAPSQSSLGQSSLGKFSLGKSRAVQEDFTKFLHSEKDLTDFMTTTLTEYMPRGPAQVMSLIQQFWKQSTGKELKDDVFQVIYTSLQRYPLPVLAKSVVKAAKYGEGKTKPTRYIQTVFDKQLKEYEKERSP